MDDEIRITVIATGFDTPHRCGAKPRIAEPVHAVAAGSGSPTTGSVHSQRRDAVDNLDVPYVYAAAGGLRR